MDRLMPVLHNLESGGQTWRENKVPLERVLTINEPIGDACPSVWNRVKQRIEALFAEADRHSPRM
jgi:putative hydrolases of HD superfamily